MRAHVNKTEFIPPADQTFNKALQAYEAGDSAEAQILCKALLVQSPVHPGAHHLSGTIALEQGNTALALQHFQTAAQLAPRNPGIHKSLGNTYLQLRRWQQAIVAYQQALNLGAKDAGIHNNLGLALKEIGELDNAVRAYHAALTLDESDPHIFNNLGHALSARNDYPGAIRAYLRAMELAPNNADMWANLATVYEQSNQLSDAQLALEKGLAIDPTHAALILVAAKYARRNKEYQSALDMLQKTHVPMELPIQRAYEFEYGRNYDKLKTPDKAYEHFLKGNQLTTRIWPDSEKYATGYQQELEKLRSTFTPEWVSSWNPVAPENLRKAPVFLIGFPRSGTTLLDTILGAHPGIQVLEEPPTTNKLIEAIQHFPGGYPQALTTLSNKQITELRQLYWRYVPAHSERSKNNILVLDKNPLNTGQAGTIHRVFPQAKFIFTLRHPCDVCLSCFMQEFTPNPGTLNFLNLQDTARLYSQVMDLWILYQRLLPLNVHLLRYETLVTDTQGTIQNLMKFLDLEWHPNLQDHTHHALKRGRINTASYHQVVQPIYPDAIERWRRYAKHFGSSLEILKKYGDIFGYAI